MGVGFVVVEFGVLGPPIFSPKVPKHLVRRVWDLWTENQGAPKTPNSTMTDPTPLLGPLITFRDISFGPLSEKSPRP